MWKIKDVKNNGKRLLKNNLWTLLLIGIFMTLIINEYVLNNDGFNNLKVVEEFVQDKQEGKETVFLDKENADVIINEYFDKIILRLLSGNMSEIIKNYNEKNNIYKGVFFSAFSLITKGQIQLQNFVNVIIQYENKEAVHGALLIIAALLGFVIRIFIANPILIGESRAFLESKNYKKTKIKKLTFAFKRGRYLSVVKAMLTMRIYKMLWNFTIVGGIIKNYSYKMVTYILAENPNIDRKDAIKISREMMNGNKFQTVKLDLSFVGLWILQYITFGIFGIYVAPYYKATYTELYILLREDYIKNKKYKFELLNDEKLYEKNDLEKYPENKPSKKSRIDYNKNYEPTSIILFFFIFSFVGWLWEVMLYLFRDGILVNRGTMYGPWLPIYGVGCTLIILLLKFEKIRKVFKNPFLTFNIVMILCSVIEYATSWFIEVTSGVRYWDYTGVFLNLNGRICLECSLFFGLGGCLCLYIIAPFLEKQIQKLDNKIKIAVCLILTLIFGSDSIYSRFHPHMGEGITTSTENTKQ